MIGLSQICVIDDYQTRTVKSSDNQPFLSLFSERVCAFYVSTHCSTIPDLERITPVFAGFHSAVSAIYDWLADL